MSAKKAKILRRNSYGKRSLKASFCRQALKDANPEIVDFTSVFTRFAAWSPFARDMKIKANTCAKTLENGTKQQTKNNAKRMTKH